MQLLMYADTLIKFLKTNVRELKSKAGPSLLCPYSIDIGKKVINDFTVTTSAGR